MIITILSFFFVLSLLVVVHEFGHYIVAKLGGIGVERFSVGYPPRLFGIKIGETDYCVSAIPFGGYVKLIGQEDFGKEDEEIQGKRDFRNKPALLRAGVIVAGSLMNLITAVIIFAILFVVHGVPENSNIVGYVEQSSLAYSMGVMPGDEFIKVNGKEKSKLEEFMVPLYTETSVNLTVRRNGAEKTLTSSRMLGQKEDFGIMPFYDAKVGSVVSGGPAGSAGVKPGDIIKAVGEQPVNGWYQMSKIVKACPDSLMVFKILRNGQEIKIPIKTRLEYETTPDGKKIAVGKIGVTLEFPRKKVGFIEASAIAFDKTVFICKEMLDFLWKLITGRMSSKLLGGPIMIAQLAGESAKSGFSTLLSLTAFISINLGILNLFPLPALDGGHILIIMIESVIRRKISLKIRMAVQQIGILLFLFLMIYVTFNDVMRLDSISKFFGK